MPLLWRGITARCCSCSEVLFTFRPAAIGAGHAVAFGAQSVALAFGAFFVDCLVVALVLVLCSLVLLAFVVDFGESRADGAAARE